MLGRDTFVDITHVTVLGRFVFVCKRQLQMSLSVSYWSLFTSIRHINHRHGSTKQQFDPHELKLRCRLSLLRVGWSWRMKCQYSQFQANFLQSAGKIQNIVETYYEPCKTASEIIAAMSFWNTMRRSGNSYRS